MVRNTTTASNHKHGSLMHKIFLSSNNTYRLYETMHVISDLQQEYDYSVVHISRTYLRTQPGNYRDITSVQGCSECFIIFPLSYHSCKFFCWIHLSLRLLNRNNTIRPRQINMNASQVANTVTIRFTLFITKYISISIKGFLLFLFPGTGGGGERESTHTISCR